MNRKEYDVIILGCGISGMMAALKLCKSGSVKPEKIIILEKEGCPGGLLRSTSHNSYWYDHGVFFFHHNSLDSNEFHVFNKFPNLFVKVENLPESAFFNNVRKSYPFNPKQLLFSLSLFDIMLFPFVFFKYWLRRNWAEKNNNLKNWLYNRITPSLYKFTGLDQYILKLMGLPIDKLSYRFGEDRLAFIDDMSKPSRFIQSNINRILNRSKIKGSTFNVYYPKGKGVSEISQDIAKALLDEGLIIQYNTVLSEISLNENNHNQKIISFTSGSVQFEIQSENIISTIPLDSLAKCFDGEIYEKLSTYVEKLSYRSLLIINFIIDDPNFIKNSHEVVYSLDSVDLWKRLFVRKFDSDTCSITVEVPFDKGDTVDREKVIDSVKKSIFEKFKSFRVSSIISQSSTIVENAYPVAFISYAETLVEINRILNELDIFTAGRQGQYDYCNVTGAIRWGESAAQKVMLAKNV